MDLRVRLAEAKDRARANFEYSEHVGIIRPAHANTSLPTNSRAYQMQRANDELRLVEHAPGSMTMTLTPCLRSAS